jgi:hypothetical protein
MIMNRREMIFRTAAATLGLAISGCAAQTGSASNRSKKVLFFSKSSGYEHSVIKRKDNELSFAEKILADLGPTHGIDFTFSKDGSLFTPEYLAQFDAFFFYTTGNLTKDSGDKNPPMTAAGKAAFLDAIKAGKGFVGTHSASDTFHTGEDNDMGMGNRQKHYQNHGANADPYIRMLGAEFIVHGKQQVATAHVVDPKFPGMVQQDLSVNEEWYSLGDFSPDLHVLLVQETGDMTGSPYQRPPYPSTWARMHGRGRVFYTNLGHREDVWTNPLYQQILLGGIAWAVRNVNASVTPNIQSAAPGCLTLPPQS